MELRVGIDVGGTFTDLCAVDAASGKRYFHKTRSTPANPPEAIFKGLEEILAMLDAAAGDIAFLGHGTTTATNMIIERQGAKTAFLTTRGFRDVIELARQARPDLFDYRKERTPPLVRRKLRCEVDERLDAMGRILVPLAMKQVEEIAQEWRREGVESVAIGFLHSYRDPSHEQAAARVIRQFMPDASITLSSEINPEPREFERFSTAVANAFIAPRMAQYARELSEGLQVRGVGPDPFTISSNGGLLDAITLARQPVRTALSGPAAGVTGAARLLALDSDAITFDVGGTSTDIAHLRAGSPAYTAERMVAGLPIRSTMVEMEVIGAGGGSIARIDKGGALRVGPQSAGAEPGPVAYGLGGDQPTLTDAAAVLGWLDPKGLLDGRVPLDLAAAEAAISSQIAMPLGLDAVSAAEGIVRIAVANMARAIRSLTVRKGVDVRYSTLVAYGGAGPLFATAVANMLGIQRINVPLAPGTLCAQAMLVCDLAIDLSTSVFLPLAPDSQTEFKVRLQQLEHEGHEWLERQQVALSKRRFEITLEARYTGQNFEIHVPFDHEPADQLIQAFHRLHHKELGFSLADHPIEIVTIRMKAIGPIARLKRSKELQSAEEPQLRHMRADGETFQAPVWRRSALPSNSLAGPLIIQEMSTTTIVPAGWQVDKGEHGDLRMERRP